MKRLAGLFLATVAVVAVDSVLAADVPVKAPVVKAPVVETVASWSGCYVAAGGGYGLWNQDSTRTTNPSFGPVTVTAATTTSGGRGWFGTVGGGCDYQVSDRVVIGAFADYDLSDLKGDYINAANNYIGDEKLRSSWAVGVRVGWLATPDILTYVTGGFTRARFSRVDPNDGSIPPGFIGVIHLPATTYSGWFVGGGTELMLAPSWFIRTEYRYAHYDAKYTPEILNATGAELNFGTSNEKIVQTVRSELVWKWNGGATVVKPRTVQPSVNWTGCHLAAGGGYGMWNQDSAYQTDPTFGPVTVFTTTQTSGGRGWFATVGGGCDYQAGGRWVIGAFADYDFSNIKSDYLAATIFLGAEKLRSSWAAGGRVGWLATPAVLSYFTGGYTQAHFSRVDQISLSNPPVSFGSHFPATTYSGWFLGGGTEIMLAASWFVRGEYRYARYDNEFVPLVSTATGARLGVGLDNEPVVQTIRTELVWRWNWSGPVGAAH